MNHFLSHITVFLLVSTISFSSFKLGIENISLATIAHVTKKNPKKINIGLVTNQTGKTQDGTRSIDFILQKGIPLSTLFTAEHGINGTIGAAKEIHNDHDEKTGLPIISLYQSEEKKQIDPGTFDGFDLLLFDMQDVGVRHYTYISTLHRVLERTAESGIPLVVCDRPNPLGGIMEGPLVEKNLHSFISIAPIPLRHGMTIGELALFFNKRIPKKNAQLFVLSMTNYSRKIQCNNELLAPLSPNIPSLKAAHGYSFLGLLSEVRPFDTGVRTPHAFQKIGLPSNMVSSACWDEVQKLLLSHDISSHFTTYTRGIQNNPYEGLVLDIKNIEHVRSFSLFMSLIGIFQKHAVPLVFSPLFDKAVGVSLVKESFEKETVKEKTLKLIKKNIIHFYNNADDCFLYKPYPTIKVSMMQKPFLTEYRDHQYQWIHA